MEGNEMSEGINRRGLIAVTGATLAVAACGEVAKQGEDKKIKMPILGYPENYGKNPNFPKEGNSNFSARYIGVIDIRAAGGWKLDINHAAFDCKEGATDATRLDKAIKALSGKRMPGKSRFKELKNELTPFNRKLANGDNYDSANFDKLLGFKSPNELFIFIEGDVELTQQAYLSFSPLGADLKPRDQNYAFFDAREIDTAKLQGLKGRMISVRNYMTDKDDKLIGKDQPTPSQNYAMNIHFTVPGKGGTRIPMIIDPDTGNGAGNEP
jgi:hypothetical protein